MSNVSVRDVSGPYQRLPELADAEYEALKADIAHRGVLIPVELDEEGRILDGHHRVAACRELGITTYPRMVRAGLSDDEKVVFALTVNLRRRHLDRSSRRRHLQELADLGWSNRKIATMTGISEPTVRRDLVDRAHGDTATPEAAAESRRVIGRDGKSYPARRPTTVFAATAHEQRRAQEALRQLGDEAPPRTVELRRAERLARDQRARKSRQESDDTTLPGEYQVITSAIADLQVEGHSVALILTDPPYTAAAMHTWDDLAAQARRWLRPGGLLAAYCGQMHLPTAITSLTRHLAYWWTVAAVHQGPVAQVRPRHIGSGWKPILLFRAPGEASEPPFILDVLRGAGPQKDLHPWQQGQPEAETLIRQLGRPGDLIVDPFLGSGTIAAATAAVGSRRFIGADIDPQATATTRSRLLASLPADVSTESLDDPAV